MFKVVRYLNIVHLEMFEKKPVEEAAQELLTRLGVTDIFRDSRELLLYYRKMEKNV